MSFDIADQTEAAAERADAAAALRGEPARFDDSEREDELLANPETFANWLADECNNCTRERVFGMPSADHLVQELCDNASIARLVAYLMYPRADVRALAAYELRGRYLAAFKVVQQ